MIHDSMDRKTSLGAGLPSLPKAKRVADLNSGEAGALDDGGGDVGTGD